MLLRGIDNLVNDRAVEPRRQLCRNLIDRLLLSEIAAVEKLRVGQQVKEFVIIYGCVGIEEFVVVAPIAAPLKKCRDLPPAFIREGKIHGPAAKIRLSHGDERKGVVAEGDRVLRGPATRVQQHGEEHKEQNR